MTRSHRPAWVLPLPVWGLLAISAATLSACQDSDLGSCNEATLDVTAATAALGRCTACHSEGITGDARQGAPAALDFDTADDVNDFAEEMWVEIDADRMPPPAPAGTGKLSGDEKEALRNWLACGVEEIGGGCNPATDGEWTCLWNALTTDHQCASCHSEAGKALGGGVALGEVGDACGVREALLSGSGSGPECGTAGAYLSAGDPEGSLLLDKLSGTPSCGAAMPFGPAEGVEGLDPDLYARLVQWVQDGAEAPECP